MTKKQLQNELIENHSAFVAYISSLSNDEFVRKQSAEKWSAGQQLEHICLSTKPVNLAFSLPKFLLRILFGKATSKRNYDQLVAAYQNTLDKGGKAGKNYTPKLVRIDQKQTLIEVLNKTINALSKKINRCEEEDLDKYLLPHPLIGKISLREMLYFTIYHIQHHHQKTIENLEQ